MLLVILLSNQLARVLSQAAANDFPREVVFALIGLTSAGYLTVIVPDRLLPRHHAGARPPVSRERDGGDPVVRRRAGGVVPADRPVSASAIAALLVWLSFWAIPQAAARAQQIRVEALRDAQFGALEPGRFRTFGGGNVVFYAERVDDNGILHNVNVFVDRTEEPDSDGKMEIWVATRAEQRGAGQADQTFVLYDGRRYEGVPGSGEFRVIQFAEGGIPIRLGELNGTRRARRELKPTRELLQSSDPARCAPSCSGASPRPILALVLMVLAVPLARLRPRQGRFGRIGIAILVYFLYSQLLDAARTWVEAGVVPEFVGMWWVHAIALCARLWLLVRESPPGRPRAVAVPA